MEDDTDTALRALHQWQKSKKNKKEDEKFWKITEEKLINKLLKKKKLITMESSKLKNFFYNLGFSDAFPLGKFEEHLDKILNLNDPMHRGIIIGLLMTSKYNTLEPFTPFQEKNVPPEQSDEVEKISSDLGRYLIQILKKTKRKKTKRRKTK